MIWKGRREDFSPLKIPHKYYVYALKIYEHSNPIYIGKGSGYRCKGHKGVGAGNQAIRKITEKYPNYYIEILTSSDNESVVYQLEKVYISKFGKKCEGGLLLNFSDGGRNTASGYFDKEENRKAFSLKKSALSGKAVYVEGFIFPSKRIAMRAMGRDRNHLKFLIKTKRAFQLDSDIEVLLQKESEYFICIKEMMLKYAQKSEYGTYMGKKRKVRIGTTVYESLTDAAMQNGVAVCTIANRLRNGNQKDTYYAEDL